MKKIIGKILIIFLILLASIGLFVVGSGYDMYKKAVEKVPIETQVKKIEAKENYTELEEMPQIYKDAVISVEDHRFYEHNGIDIIAIARAIFNDIRTLSFAEGGSTITQQLAKNIYFTQEKKITRKIAEVFAAFYIEDKLEKNQILELYLNTSYFGDGYDTVKEASKGYFNKEPINLNDSEATMLAGIPNAPSVYAPTQNLKLAKKRQKQVLEQMCKYGKLKEEDANRILETGNK